MSSKNANKDSISAIDAWGRYPELEKIMKDKLVRMGIEPTRNNIASYLDVTPYKLGRWEKTQKPSYEDLQILAQKFNLSTDWLLFGTGDASAEYPESEFNSEYVMICDTLHEWISLINDSKEIIATIGGMRIEELEDCISAKKLPPLTAIARWIHHYKLNANHLLAQIGPPFLNVDEYTMPGPIDHIRKKRNDYGRHLPDIDGKNSGYNLPDGRVIKTGPKAEHELLCIIQDQADIISHLKRKAEKRGEEQVDPEELVTLRSKYIEVLEENRRLAAELREANKSSQKTDSVAHDAPIRI